MRVVRQARQSLQSLAQAHVVRDERAALAFERECHALPLEGQERGVQARRASRDHRERAGELRRVHGGVDCERSRAVVRTRTARDGVLLVARGGRSRALALTARGFRAGRSIVRFRALAPALLLRSLLADLVHQPSGLASGHRAAERVAAAILAVPAEVTRASRVPKAKLWKTRDSRGAILPKTTCTAVLGCFKPIIGARHVRRPD